MKNGTWELLVRRQSSKLMVAILLSGLLGIVPPLAPSQVVNSSKNPNQIAILHWYAANLTTKFTVGNTPAAVAFDGAYIWVANQGSNNVTKLRARSPHWYSGRLTPTKINPILPLFEDIEASFPFHVCF